MGRRLHVRVYIALLVMLPVGGFLSMATLAAKPKYIAWQEAKDVDTRVNRVARLTRLSRIVAEEELPEQVLSSAKRVKLSPQLAASLFGFDPAQSLREHRKRTDEAIRLNADDPLAPTITKLMAEVRGLDPDNDSGIHQGYLAIHQIIDRETSKEIDSPGIRMLAGDSQLRHDLENISKVFLLSSTISKQHQAIFDAFTVGKVNPAMRNQIGALRIEEANRFDDLALTVGPRWAISVKQLIAESSDSIVGQEIDRVGSGEVVDLAALPPIRIAAAVRSGAARNESLDPILYGFLRDSLRSATELRKDTASEWETMLAVAVLLLFVTVVLAFVIARLLAKPLRDLASRARSVASGDLDAPPAMLRGPREVAVVASVVNDLVANLKRVQGQASALARGEIDNAILVDQIPGALGLQMKASVDRLSRSIREREELQEMLSQQATHDSLTGLPNRAAALMALDHAYARSRRSGETTAVLFVDLDDFKRANDDHDHSVGDEVLKIAGQRILEVVRGGDVVARLGGDEFLIIADSVGTADRVRELGDRIVARLTDPVIVSELTIRISASIGYSIVEESAEGGREFLRRADLAMYRAKQLGKGRVVEFDEALNKEFGERLDLQQAMIQALRSESDELQLHYQPIFETTTGKLRSAEALLRWDRPGFGMQAPGHFIPILESSPVILDIDRWVLLRATSQIADMRATVDGLEGLSVAVNLSGRHLLSPTLVDDVKIALMASGLTPSALTIEITETVLVTDLLTTVENLKAIRALGVKISIDDFGTGYTSIGQLSRLPIDILKIDRSFIDQIDVPGNQRIVELIIELGHTLGFEIVGEGIEDEHQREILQSLSCDKVQGFLLSKPLSHGSFLDSFAASVN
jgi:diguanylate cyclase (GGDEF)-like protein